MARRRSRDEEEEELEDSDDETEDEYDDEDDEDDDEDEARVQLREIHEWLREARDGPRKKARRGDSSQKKNGSGRRVKRVRVQDDQKKKKPSQTSKTINFGNVFRKRRSG